MKKHLIYLTATALFLGVFNTSALESNDQLEVVAEKTKQQLRREYYQAEEDFYKAYNKHAPAEFQIKCKKRKEGVGSQLRVRECLPNFLNVINDKMGDVVEIRKAKNAQLMQLIASVVAEKPEVSAQYANYVKAKKALSERE